MRALVHAAEIGLTHHRLDVRQREDTAAVGLGQRVEDAGLVGAYETLRGIGQRDLVDDVRQRRVQRK